MNDCEIIYSGLNNITPGQGAGKHFIESRYTTAISIRAIFVTALAAILQR
jgi:hypothetical protein